MNVKEVRKLRLAELVRKYGSLKEVAAQVIAHESGKGKRVPKGINYLDRYLSQINTGDRGMGSRFARRLEIAFGKREGWMDHVGASSAEANDLLNIWGQFPEDEQKRILEELKIRLSVFKNKTIIIQEVTETIKRPPKTFS